MKLSCIKATELVEKKGVVGLSFVENLKLRLHLSMCSSCKEYEHQSHLIDAALSRSGKTNPPVRFSEDEKKKIIQKCKGE